MKQHEFHTDIKHQYTVRLLGTRSLSIRVVYSHIANYTAAKGCWCGDMKDLARQIEIPYTTVCDQMKELIKRGLVVKDGDRYSTNVVPENTTVVSENTNVVSKNTNVVSPHTPLYNNIQKKEINNIQSNPKDMDGGEVSPDRTGQDEIDNFSLELFTQYYRLMPYKAKSTAIKQRAQNEFCALSHETQQALIGQLRREIDDGVDIHPRSPLLYLRSFVKPPPPPQEEPDGEPHNYNHEEPPKDKFLQPAFYKGEWGMYCTADIIKFNLLTKEKMN